MTAVEQLREEALKAGGIPCMRCSCGWYLYRDVSDTFLCAICGFVEYCDDYRMTVEALRAYQEREYRRGRLYIKGDKPHAPVKR